MNFAVFDPSSAIIQIFIDIFDFLFYIFKNRTNLVYLSFKPYGKIAISHFYRAMLC